MEYQCSGWYLWISTPAARICSSSASSIFWLPTQSMRMCTLTPARERSESASAKARPTFPDQ